MTKDLLHYSQALYLIADETSQVKTYRLNAIELIKTFKDNSQFVHLLDCQFVELSTRLKIIDDVFYQHLDETFLAFLKIVIESHKISKIVRILSDFVSLCNKKLSIREGIVYSISKLDEKTLNEIQSVMEAKIQQELYLKNRIDENLIAGIKLTIDGHVYDYSVSNILKDLHKKLLTSKEK